MAFFQGGRALLQVRQFKLTSVYPFRKYEVLDAPEWFVIGIGAAGLVYLTWLSIRLLNGKTVPKLARD